MSYRLVIDSQQRQENHLNLSPEQEHYLKRVLRLNPGDTFVVLDGLGESWLAALDLNQKTATIIESLQESNELSLSINLMVALPKGSGFEEIVRSCTELGVKTFIPVLSERTLLVPSPYKVARWRKIALEASEQSERQIVPTILDPVDLTTALSGLDIPQMTAYLCVTRLQAIHLAQSLLDVPPKQSLLIAIGPEGGWTEKEIEQFLSLGFKTVTLGRRILRTITAPLVAVSLVSAMLKE